MTAQTGRSVSRYTNFIIKDSGAVLRAIPIDSINGVGLEYEVKDLTAFQDAIRGVLLNTPNFELTITGPFDNSAAAAVPALSGSHTVLSGIVGVNTPLSFDVQMGIRHAWEAGEPQFGITGSTTNGILCVSYTVNPEDGKFTAKFQMAAGSAAPAWGTAAET